MQRQNIFSLIRFSRVLWLSLLVLVLGGLLEPEAAAQPVSFAPHADFGTGSGPDSVAVGDFNGDGKLDLAAANADSNTVSILLGTGTGSFGAKTDFGTGLVPISVAVGDFNGDGKLDLAVANRDSNTISILLGTGTGSFSAKTDFATGSVPRSVAVGDFNGDGKLDLATANESSDTVSILLGTGTGSFGAKSDFGTGSFPFSVAVGDFNDDGKLDLAVANRVGNTVSILLGTGTGSFGAKTDFGTGSVSRSVAVGDFNSDGKLDLAVANQNDNTVSILPGTGSGSFGTKTDFGTGSAPASVAVGDFNVDGKLDLATANLNSNTVSILPGTGTGSFGAKTDFGTGSSPGSVAVADFNSDGKLDLAVANFFSSTVSILLNTTPVVCSGAFSPRTDFGLVGTTPSVAAGDFNGDGKLDLAVASQGIGTVSILLGTGTGSFGPKTDFATGSSPISVAVGDFNGDGKLDLAVANVVSNTVSILLGTGTGSFGPKTDFGTGNAPESVAVGDFNRDGKLDLAVATLDSTVSVLLGTGTGSFGARTDFGTGAFPYSVAVGDFNGDGKLDLAAPNFSSDTISILLGTGTGSFGVKTDFATSVNPLSVAVDDFNGDGKLDLAVANQGSNTVSILLGTGTGSFGARTDFVTGSLPSSVAADDFNDDGKLDLAAANQGSDTVSILLGTGTGSFGPNTDFGTADRPYSVAVGDFNRDGKFDLATANLSTSVSILLNACTDNQPPTITCPANVNASAKSACPIATSSVVTYPPPTATDNFPGVTVVCNPASGSIFPVGTTTVTCTATDASGNTATCSFTVNVFSFCLQDETSPGNVVLINAQTGDYFFCCGGVPIASGRGTLTTHGCIGTIDHTKGDRRVHIQWDTSANGGAGAGTAFVQVGTNRTVCQITDRKMADNNCACSNSPPAITVNQVPCVITCPANKVQASDPNQCGAVVTYNAPTTVGTCGTVNCLPLSSSFFTVGTTTVTCTTTAGPSCMFTVTIQDTQPPSITCPANINVAGAATCPPISSRTVDYTVTPSDNCAGATVVCSPAPGSYFPVGTSSVSCTATDASGNTSSCSFLVTVFTACLTDASDANNVVLFNTQTGDYRFCCGGMLLATGRGVLTFANCIGTIDDQRGTRKVHIGFNFTANGGNGTASLFLAGSSNQKCSIDDLNMADNVCTCPIGPPPAFQK